MDSSHPELVVLVHGLGRTPRSMKRLERELAAQGYQVLSPRFPTMRDSVEQLAERLEEVVSRTASPGQRVSFVAHSLGGIVVRRYLGNRPDVIVGRVVMLSPPNGGSEIADLLRRIPILGGHSRSARGELGTAPEQLPARLGPVAFELGVIAGNRSLNPLFSLLLPGPDDGMVSVQRTKVAGMTDFLVVSRTHTFIMRGPEVIEQTLEFLRRGRFSRPSPRPQDGAG